MSRVSCVAVVAIVAGFVCAEVAHASPQQFDLHCAGMEQVTYTGTTRQGHFAENLRVDLVAQQWCSDECTAIERIIPVDLNTIILAHLVEQNPPLLHDEYLNRRTGELSYSTHLDAGANETTLIAAVPCSIQPFSGFPAPKF